MTEAISEDQIKTQLYCPALYHLGGTAYQYDKSQILVKISFEQFMLAHIKGEIHDFDHTLFGIINNNINRIYALDDLLPSNIQMIYSHTIAWFHQFLDHYPLAEYTPITSRMLPTVKIAGLEIRLEYSAIFKKNNRNWLHGMVFLPKKDIRDYKQDVFNAIKIRYLEVFSSWTQSEASVANLHIFSPTPISSATKLKKSEQKVVSHRYTLGAKDLPAYIDKKIIKTLEAYKSIKYFSPKPYCRDYGCSKRQECSEL